MKIAPPSQLAVRATDTTARSELVVRYAASYACTLIAIAAAQLIIPTAFALALAGITLLGLPISLYWRWSGLRLFGRPIPRFFINSFVVILAGVACIYLLLLTQHELFSRGLYQTVVISHTAGESVAILMNMFLIFATARSLATITDKDAVLSAVPSFSVLLLLIVIDRGPAVVAYFLLWALASAVLFALDHRQESRKMAGGYIPALEQGQDIKLSARGLATVMGLSLVCAIGISYLISSRDPEERGVVETWILGMAGRMTQLALNLPEVSVNSGPERQIDFSSGPALPTRAELWSVAAMSYDRQPIRPEYWRMFTLSVYDGSTWSQQSGSGTALPFEHLDESQWPPLPSQSQQNSPTFATGQPSGNSTLPGGRTLRPGLRPESAQNQDSSQGRNEDGSRLRRSGYDIQRHPYGSRILHSFGGSQKYVVQIIEPLTSNIGFVPLLPAPRALRVRTEEPSDSIRVRQDGAVDIGVAQPGQTLLALSSVSPGDTYGLNREDLPPTSSSKDSMRNPAAVLNEAERKHNLHLPEGLRAPDSRVMQLAQEVLRQGKPDESNYQRARRLALMLQERAVYTLRPPAIPEGIDAAEYFLFESRRGYCTYFAGALTVLCRASGMPARVVSGFVNPEWQGNGQRGIIREANAHAWTEVWVEGWGWVSVDATPPDDRGENAPGWWENWTALFAATFDAGRFWLQSNLRLAAWLALLAVAAVLLLSVRLGIFDPLRARWQHATQGRVQLNQDQSRRLISRAYGQASRKLARRFRHRTQWETPGEWLCSAEAALELQDPQPLRELTQLYEAAKYSPRDITGEDGAAAYDALRRLSWQRRPGQSGNVNAGRTLISGLLRK